MALFKGNYINLRTIEGTYSERRIIKELFDIEDIKKYYTIDKKYHNNIDAFFDFMVLNNKSKGSYLFNLIIEKHDETKIGLISANGNKIEHYTTDGLLVEDGMWNIGYAIHPNYRGNGYATDALNLLCFVLQQFVAPEIKYFMLDIAISNTISESIAKKSGFEIMKSRFGGNQGFLDPFDPYNLDIHRYWIRNIYPQGRRIFLVSKAIKAFEREAYTLSAKCFEEALQESFVLGGPSDAQIFANLGMAYSALGEYQEAYDTLMEAYNAGIQNESVVRELNWLRRNADVW